MQVINCYNIIVILLCTIYIIRVKINRIFKYNIYYQQQSLKYSQFTGICWVILIVNNFISQKYNFTYVWPIIL